MNRRRIIHVLLMLATGCAAAANKCPPIEPGMAGLEIRAVAEPKQGAAANAGDTYDSATATGRFQPIDYDNLTGIVVWAEPANASTATSTSTTAIEFDDRGQVGDRAVQG